MARNILKRKMRGGGLVETPSDITPILLTVLIVVLLFIAYQIYKMMNSPVSLGSIGISQKEPTIIFSGGGGQVQQDDRYAMPPKPLRFWRAPPDPGVWNPTTLPSVASRGLPESFQTIGLLKYPGGDLKPLLGRRTAGSNDRWNYYTRTDTYNPVPVPLKQKNRDCMDDVGCNEVFDGDRLKSLNGEEVQVSLYKMNGPTYIPSI